MQHGAGMLIAVRLELQTNMLSIHCPSSSCDCINTKPDYPFLKPGKVDMVLPTWNLGHVASENIEGL